MGLVNAFASGMCMMYSFISFLTGDIEAGVLLLIGGIANAIAAIGNYVNR